ncbi:MAG TPA: hypothetical protein VID26_09190 [Candidatus Limnocylindrales bacterium]|jgi:hypothetical protein
MAHAQPAHGTLVWIDAHEAMVLSWLDEAAHVTRFRSDVPDHRKSTGHVRHDASIRHGGGGGSAQDAGEPRREEHLNQFVDLVARRLPADDDLLILGPGTVRERLERHVRELDHHLLHSRTVTVTASGPRTERQLIAQLRTAVGAEPKRGPARESRDQQPGRIPREGSVRKTADEWEA